MVSGKQKAQNELRLEKDALKGKKSFFRYIQNKGKQNNNNHHQAELFNSYIGLVFLN